MTLSPGSFVFFAVICAAVGAIRLVEMTLSRRHQQELAAWGGRRRAEPLFPLMVALHTAVILGGPLEVLLFHRPFIAALACPALLVLLASQGLRWWVIHTLGLHWNVQIVSSTSILGVITSGPYQWIRHPNYVAVFVELVALPLVHGAWLTSLLGAVAHAAILRSRIKAEEQVLLADPLYRVSMGRKPRFVPRWSELVRRRTLTANDGPSFS